MFLFESHLFMSYTKREHSIELCFLFSGAGGGTTRTRVTKIVHWTIFTFVQPDLNQSELGTFLFESHLFISYTKREHSIELCSLFFWCQRRRYLQLAIGSLDEWLNSHSSYKYIIKFFYKNQVFLKKLYTISKK